MADTTENPLSKSAQIAISNFGQLAAWGNTEQGFLAAMKMFDHQGESFHAHLWTILPKTESGTLDLAKVILVLTVLTQGTIRDKATLVFRSADVNHDGYVTKEELTPICAALHTANMKVEEKLALTKAIAEEGQGLYESGSTPVNPLTQSGVQRKNTYKNTVKEIRQQVDAIFELIDTNHDGKLSQEEWLAHVDKSPELNALLHYFF